ncbi:MAG: hypothetical protein M1827_000551 [Pycnora praestabilis]|nr:MAG: hypothetical protein M1827_000551 [Pycnora praestabilis]
MASPVEQAWSSAQRNERALLASLAEKNTTFNDIDELIAHFATGKNVEGRLWDAHGKINNRFRRALSRFRGEEGTRKVVEQRKLKKHYLEFIKTSQRYYRGYIQRLSSSFGGIPELEEVAHAFGLKGSRGQAQVPRNIDHLVLLSCHQTLVRLGDLSRYRESEIMTKDRNWGPAIGYYDLAGAINPASGASHNQLAVIALADNNHLRATYHLYRALAIEEPHPNAKANLEVEFKKILAAWTKGSTTANVQGQSGNGPGNALLAWFMRLHARCYKGHDFVEHDELESEVLSHLAVDLKERSMEGTLHKFTLINIAAEYFAGIRVQEDSASEHNRQAFLFFLRLNVKTFFTFLQVLQPELERLFGDDVTIQNGDGSNNGSDKITAVARRVLPGLRHYSSWLVSNSAFLVAQVGDTSLNVQIKELWKIYANTLTLLAATFPAAELPSVEYMLEEDEDTVGFKPFSSELAQKRYFAGEMRKPKWHEQGVERCHPNIEMLARVRDFLTNGLELALDDTIPIALVDGGRFTYQEEGVPSELLASPSGHQATPSVMSVEREDIPYANGNENHKSRSVIDEEASQSVAPSEPASASISISTTMNRMVDALVDSESPDVDPKLIMPQQTTIIPPTPPEHSFEDSPNREEETSYGQMGTLTAKELVHMVHTYSPNPNVSASARHKNDETTYDPISTLTAKEFVKTVHSYSQNTAQPVVSHTTPRPALPSIWNTPFAPHTGDSSPQQRPSTATRRTTPPQQQQQQQQQWLPYNMQSSSSSGVVPDPSGNYNGTPGTPRAWGNGQHHYQIGNGTFGAHEAMKYGNGSGIGNAFDPSILSPPMYGSSQWGVSGSGRMGTGMRMGMGTRTTPPDGQGGG